MVCKGFILLAMLKTVLFVFSQYEYWIIFKYLCNSKVNALSVIGFYQLKELTMYNNYLNFSISLYWSHWGLVAFETSSRNLVSKTLSIYNYSLFLLTKGILLFCFAVVAIIACCMRSLHVVQDFALLFFFLFCFESSLALFRWWMCLTKKAWRFVCWWWRGRCDFMGSDLWRSFFSGSMSLLPAESAV